MRITLGESLSHESRQHIEVSLPSLSRLTTMMAAGTTGHRMLAYLDHGDELRKQMRANCTGWMPLRPLSPSGWMPVVTRWPLWLNKGSWCLGLGLLVPPRSTAVASEVSRGFSLLRERAMVRSNFGGWSWVRTGVS